MTGDGGESVGTVEQRIRKVADGGESGGMADAEERVVSGGGVTEQWRGGEDGKAGARF